MIFGVQKCCGMHLALVTYTALFLRQVKCIHGEDFQRRHILSRLQGDATDTSKDRNPLATSFVPGADMYLRIHFCVQFCQAFRFMYMQVFISLQTKPTTQQPLEIWENTVIFKRF